MHIMSDSPRTDSNQFSQSGETRYSTATGSPLKVLTASFARQLERELRKLEMAMPDYKQCCELREKAERELAEAQSATPASEETGTVVCTVEFVQAAKEMAEAVRWVIQDAAYKPPEEIGYIQQRWIDRLRGVERVADEKLNASTDESSKSG